MELKNVYRMYAKNIGIIPKWLKQGLVEEIKDKSYEKDKSKVLQVQS